MSNVRPEQLALVAGDLALDFANTVSFRGTPRERDHLPDVERLFDWLGYAGAVRLEALAPLRAKAGDDGRLIAEAHQLRTAIFAAGSALAAGRAPPDGDLDVVRRHAAAALGAGRIGREASKPFTLDFTSATAEAATLGAVAWAALDLLRSERLSRLKQCPACDCRWLFLDETKNGRRRWCDMATCGNRAKAARFRGRG